MMMVYAQRNLVGVWAAEDRQVAVAVVVVVVVTVVAIVVVTAIVRVVVVVGQMMS